MKTTVNINKGTKKRNMKQIHGKEDSGSKPTTLDQIWGDTGLTKYGHLDVEKYEKSLNEMTKADIQAEAHRIGIIPIDNREMLHKRLITEFNKIICFHFFRLVIFHF